MNGVRVLAYHAVAPLPFRHHDYRYGLPLPVFQAQIERLAAAGYTFIDVDGFLRFLAGRLELPPRSVLLTFDDGYASVLPAVRWLSQRGIGGVVFAMSGALTPGVPLCSVMEPVLDRDGLAALVDAGFEIGAHSHSHQALARTPRAARGDEIARSFERLAGARLGPIRLFAYPYGNYDDGVCDEVRRSGAAAAMTIDPGIVRAGDDPMRVRRIEVYRHDVGVAFRAKMATSGGVTLLRSRIRLRSRLRRLSSATR